MSDTNGAPATTSPSLKGRVKALEETLAAQQEQIVRLATGLATLLAQAVAPQMQQTLVSQLLGTKPEAAPSPGYDSATTSALNVPSPVAPALVTD